VSPVRVVLVDDQALFRAGIRMLIDSQADLEVVGEASDGRDGVAVVRATRPDVVLMDIRMPVLDGLQATAELLGDENPPRVVMLTTFDLDELVVDALRAGASGFLLKDALPADLVAAIRIVAAGEALLAPTITRRLITHFAGRAEPASEPAASLTGVTDREREVLTLVGRGLSNVEIATHLRLSLATAKTHVGRLLAKLQARDRAQLVIVAYETGLVRPLPATTPKPGRSPR